MNNNPIGVFDSGVGGLSCVPAIKDRLPQEAIVYYGDTANAPYGSRPEAEIISLAVEVAKKLTAKGCKLLSIACNTISCVAIPDIEKACPGIPVIGIVKPAAEYTAKHFNGKKVGLIATEATVRSEAYPNAIKEFGGKIDFKAKATPDFVPLIEAGKADSLEMRECIKKNLDEFVQGLDALILGCTHYPFIKDQIKTLYPMLRIIDPAKALADKTVEILGQNDLLSEVKACEDQYISSRDSKAFDDIAASITKEEYKYDLEKLTDNLKNNGFDVSHFKTADEASEYLNTVIDGKTVGFGGTVTAEEMGMYDLLSSHNTVHSHWHGGDAFKGTQAEVFITSTNGLAETGEIINIDGTGNRVASLSYGHKQIYMIVGKNKIAPDYDKALWRARNIAAPKNAQRLNRKTPCAIEGNKCYNCNSKDRICKSLSVLWKKPNAITNFEIVLIDENLGY